MTQLLESVLRGGLIEDIDFEWPHFRWSSLACGQIDLWRSSPLILRTSTIHLSQEQVNYMFAELPMAEQERALRFRRVIDHDTFVFSHWLLRYTLGTLLGTSGMELELVVGEFGKPQLAQPDGRLAFNLSHSEQEIALIFSGTSSVGIDLERFERKTDWEDIARRFFHRLEVTALLSEDESERSKAFIRLWTLKEAVIKAMGRGLSQSLDSFAIPRFMFMEGISGSIRVGEASVQVIPLPDDPLFAGAVALVEGRDGAR